MSSRPASEARRPRPALRLARRVAAIALATLAHAGMGVALAACAMVQEGKSSLSGLEGPEGIRLAGDAASDDGGRTVVHEGRRYALNEHMATVCLLGVDHEQAAQAQPTEGAGQADVVVVAAVNLDADEVKLIGIPRESMVDVRTNPQDGAQTRAATRSMALCLAYAYGNGGTSSCENAASAVSEALCGVPVSAYLALDLGGIVPLNDALGGVAVRALETIPGTGIVEGEDALLLGEEARAYVQWRDEEVLESPLARQARQAQYMQAYAARLLDQALRNPGTICAVYDAMAEHAVTDLSASELAYLAFALASTGAENLDVSALQGEMRHGEGYGEFHLDQAAVFETVLETYYHRVD